MAGRLVSVRTDTRNEINAERLSNIYIYISFFGGLLSVHLSIYLVLLRVCVRHVMTPYACIKSRFPWKLYDMCACVNMHIDAHARNPLSHTCWQQLAS